MFSGRVSMMALKALAKISTTIASLTSRIAMSSAIRASSGYETAMRHMMDSRDHDRDHHDRDHHDHDDPH